MEKRFYSLIMLLFSFEILSGQTPDIQKIEPQAAFPKSTIVISGNGFSSDTTQLQVWFGAVKGTIISSTDFSIEVKVPAQAQLDNIRVVNLSSKLSAESGAKFMPVYSGEGFNATKLGTPEILKCNNTIFDIISSDIDGDNKPDLIGSQSESSGNGLSLMMNKSTIGDIAFTDQLSIPSLILNAPIRFMVAKDLNMDGLPDVVASRTGNTQNIVYVLRNTSIPGNPSFAAPVVLTLDLAHFAAQVEIEDLNEDGRPEIIVANSNGNELYIFKNESIDGKLSINPSPTKIPVTGASETFALEIQDLDGDHKADIIATRFQEKNLFILKNISTPSTFNFTISTITTSGKFQDVTSADFNKDGKLDIAVIDFYSGAYVFMNQSTDNTPSFSTFPITLSTDSRPSGLDVSDLNGDGFADFIIACQNAPALNAYINEGNSSSVSFTKVLITTPQNNWNVRPEDFDGDGKPDIAYTPFLSTAFTVEILKNKNCHKPQILNTEPLTLCASQTIRLNTIPIPGVTFDWSNGFTSMSTGSQPFDDVTAAATYTVTATGEASACSVTSAPITIQSGAGSLPADPTITTNSPVCVGSALTISTPAVSGATYEWVGPNNFTSNLQTISISSASITQAGNYSLTVKVGDCSSNTVIKRVDVVSFGNFSIASTVADNKLCQGQTLALSINAQSGYTYQWLKNGANLSSQTAPTLSVDQEGSYKVNITNTTLGCFKETDPVSVVVFAAPVASFTVAPTGCVDNVVGFTDNSIADARVTSLTYAWEFGDNTTSSVKNPTHTYTTALAYKPKLTVSYGGVTGCTNSVIKDINVLSVTSPVITASKSELCANGSENSALIVNGTFNSFLWTTNSVTSSTNVTLPGVYSVTTTDANGCPDTADIVITEKTDCSPISTDIQIPLLFTPNGDTQNDFWVITGIENKGECTMNVFDGRGRKIFQKKGYPVAGWDGISDDGKEVPSGTYFYVLNCPDETPTTGSVLIVR